MGIWSTVKSGIPRPVKKLLRPIHNCVTNKHSAELGYWRDYFAQNGAADSSTYYQQHLLGMAMEQDDSFLAGKVVADFGCGPLGSLRWAHSAAVRIGIDVLADQYVHYFSDHFIAHNMIYLKCTERVIPLPTRFVDVMFTLNAMDHVNDFSSMCREVLRVLKTGGDFIGGFNLEEAPTACEPQTLNEELIETHLLRHLQITSYRVSSMGSQDDPYGPLFRNECSYEKGKEGYLWVRGKKK